MPKYYDFKVCGCYLYYTTHCIVEAFHVHASDAELTEAGSAKFFVYPNGDTRVDKKGILKPHEISEIQRFIKEHYKEMFMKWSERSDNGYFGEEK